MITHRIPFHSSREVLAMKNIGLVGRLTGLASAMALALVLAACQEPSGQNAASANAGTSVAVATTQIQSSNQGLLTAYVRGAASFKPLPNCNLERLNRELFGAQPLALHLSQVNTFTGWVDPSGVATPSLWLRFDDAQAKRYLHAPFKLTTERPDVLANDPNAPRVSGFELQLPANALPAGQYHVYVVVTSGAAAHVCDNGRHINVAS